MARSTTQSVWRSGGGDQTRTTTAGSMDMTATFYIANVAASGNVTANSSLANSTVILPAGAVVTDIAITTASTSGNMSLGFTPLSNIGPGQTVSLGTAVPTGFLSNAAVNARVNVTVAGTGAGTYVGNVANATNVVIVTSTATTGSGSVAGYIKYFVSDDGQQQA